MESHISFKWKSVDIISSQGKDGPFGILSKKKNKAKNKMGTEKQNNYVVNQFQAVLFLHPLKMAETVLFHWPGMG